MVSSNLGEGLGGEPSCGLKNCPFVKILTNARELSTQEIEHTRRLHELSSCLFGDQSLRTLLTLYGFRIPYHYLVTGLPMKWVKQGVIVEERGVFK